MYRHISMLLGFLGLLLLSPLLVSAQEPIVHMTSVSWDSQVELSLDFGMVTDNGTYCNLSYVIAGDECDSILTDLGNPQLSLVEGPQSAVIEWQELLGYTSYTACVTSSSFGTGEAFATHLTVKNYVNTQLTQVYMVPITNDMPYCISGPSAYDREFLSMDFVVDVASVVPVTTEMPTDSDLVVRLIQPTETNLNLLVDLTGSSSTAPSFAISTDVDSTLETVQPMSIQDVLLAHEDYAGFYQLNFFVSYISPTAVEQDAGQTVPFAVVIYDQGQLSAIYFGQVTGANQIWTGTYPAEMVVVQDYPVYDPIFQIVAALGNPLGLG